MRARIIKRIKIPILVGDANFLSVNNHGGCFIFREIRFMSNFDKHGKCAYIEIRAYEANFFSTKARS